MQRATTFFTICHQWLFFLTLLVALVPLPHAQIIGHWQASLSVNGDPLHPVCRRAPWPWLSFGHVEHNITRGAVAGSGPKICHHSNSTYMRTAPADPSIHKSTAAEAHAGPASCRRGRALLLLVLLLGRPWPCACSHQIPSAATCNCSYPAAAAWHDAPCQKQQQQQRGAHSP
jgi:hypothetical protein